MSKPYVHNLADLTFRPAGCNGAMRSYTAKPAGQFRRLLFQKIFFLLNHKCQGKANKAFSI